MIALRCEVTVDRKCLQFFCGDVESKGDYPLRLQGKSGKSSDRGTGTTVNVFFENYDRVPVPSGHTLAALRVVVLRMRSRTFTSGEILRLRCAALRMTGVENVVFRLVSGYCGDTRGQWLRQIQNSECRMQNYPLQRGKNKISLRGLGLWSR